MGSQIEINDTLQITPEQGFPVELNLEQHLKQPIVADNFADKIFTFQNKSGIRLYHSPPVRVFLVENRNSKWIYWGFVHMVEVTHDHERQTTSGKYKIIHIYPPEEMKAAHNLIDRNKQTDYFNF